MRRRTFLAALAALIVAPKARTAVTTRSGIEKVRQLTGAQRAALAAQGLDISAGSAADVIASDKRVSRLNEETIRRNAAREAYGMLISKPADLASIYRAYGLKGGK